MSAVGAVATPLVRGACLAKNCLARGAISGILAVVNLVEVATSLAHKDVLRMAPVFGEKVPREQVELFSASFAIEHFDPKKGLHGHIGVAIERARRAVILINVSA